MCIVYVRVYMCVCVFVCCVCMCLCNACVCGTGKEEGNESTVQKVGVQSNKDPCPHHHLARLPRPHLMDTFSGDDPYHHIGESMSHTQD